MAANKLTSAEYLAAAEASSTAPSLSAWRNVERLERRGRLRLTSREWADLVRLLDRWTARDWRRFHAGSVAVPDFVKPPKET